MLVLGIETSCDECAAAVVEDGRRVLSNVVATQIPFHAEFDGVVPEIASRKHAEWILDVTARALADAGLAADGVDAVAATSRPGLAGALLVGLTFAKTFAWSLGKPFVGINHMLAHLYAPRLVEDLAYPFLGLLVSGGHTIICRADGFDDITVLGTTIDDAIGEAFDKTAKFHGWGYPGGAVIDRMARSGDPGAYRFPRPNLAKREDRRYDVSYSGLKTAVTRHLELFRVKENPTVEDLAASFQKAAVDILVDKTIAAARDQELGTVVAGGGVAANSRLRERLAAEPGLRVVFPPAEYCGDNGAMVAGIAWHYLMRGDRSPWSLNASPRVEGFKRA